MFQSFDEKGNALDALCQEFPNEAQHDLRFFVEFHHDKKIKDIIEKYREKKKWRETNLPVSRNEIMKPLQQGIFFFHGRDLNGEQTRPSVF